MNRLKCIVIDDEPLAGRGLSEYIAEVSMLDCLAVLHSPAEAMGYLKEADLMYLDINMPVISGIDFLQQLKQPPLTIITTAYQQYALQGFELDVVDYLLKPVSFPRFLKATTKAIDYLSLLRDPRAAGADKERNDYFFVKVNGVLEKVQLGEVTVIEAASNYVTIHCTGRKLITYLTLKQVKEYLPDPDFVQVHKSFVVATGMIQKIAADSLTVHGLQVPVGQNFREPAIERITRGKILKR